MRTFISFAVVFALLATPAYAASLTETQIQAIVGLVASFGASPDVVKNVEASLRGSAPASSASPQSSAVSSDVCQYASKILVNLSLGSTDATTLGQVTYLQKFLGSQVTGFFGPLTEKAVQAWQVKYGVVTSGTPETTGYGAVGPGTRATFVKVCSSSSTVPPVETAVPQQTSSSWATMNPFTADSLTPTLTGSAGGVATITLVLLNNGVKLYQSAAIAITNGKWTHTVASALAEGTYAIQLLSPEGKVLATGSMSMYSSYLPPPELVFSAVSTKVALHQTTTLSWTSTNANRCILKYSGKEESVPTNGSKVVTVAAPIEYALWCYDDPGNGNAGPSISKTVALSVVSAPTCTLTHTNEHDVEMHIVPVTLTWTSTDADYAKVQYQYGDTSLYPASLPDATPNGSMNVSQTSSVTYTFTFYGVGGSKSCSTKLVY